MWSDILDVGVFVFGFIVIVALIIYGALSYTCNGYEMATGKQTKLIAMECYIQDGNNWYAWSEYKYRLATKGEFSH